jgi:hypothetical protein
MLNTLQNYYIPRHTLSAVPSFGLFHASANAHHGGHGADVYATAGEPEPAPRSLAVAPSSLGTLVHTGQTSNCYDDVNASWVQPEALSGCRGTLGFASESPICPGTLLASHEQILAWRHRRMHRDARKSRYLRRT